MNIFLLIFLWEKNDHKIINQRLSESELGYCSVCMIVEFPFVKRVHDILNANGKNDDRWKIWSYKYRQVCVCVNTVYRHMHMN